MRESNYAFPAQNKACVCITSQLYDRRALDTSSPLPLLNSLSHLTYLTNTSPRIREILTCDGGLERLVRLLRDFCMCPPPPENPTLMFGLSPPGITRPAPTPTLNPKVFDRQAAYRFSLAFQCVVNIGVRGSEPIRARVVQAGTLDVIGCVLEAWLAAKGFAVGPSTSVTGAPRESREQRHQRRQMQNEQRQREHALELTRRLALQRSATNEDEQPATSDTDTSAATTPSNELTASTTVTVPGRERSGTVIARREWNQHAQPSAVIQRSRTVRARQAPESSAPSTSTSRPETETEDDGEPDNDVEMASQDQDTDENVPPPRRAVGIVADSPIPTAGVEVSDALDVDAHIIISTNNADDGVSDGIVALEPNVNDDLALGAPPGAPGAIDATPRTRTDTLTINTRMMNHNTGHVHGHTHTREEMTPRAVLASLPVHTSGSAPVPIPVSIETSISNAANRTGSTSMGQNARASSSSSTSATLPTATSPVAGPAHAIPPAAAATPRPSHRHHHQYHHYHHPPEDIGPFREEDVLLSLQLLAYLSKYPHVRQAFYKPRLSFHPATALAQHGTPQMATSSTQATPAAGSMPNFIDFTTGRPSMWARTGSSSLPMSDSRKDLNFFKGLALSGRSGKEKSPAVTIASESDPNIFSSNFPQANTGQPSTPMRMTNVFSLVERFTFRPSVSELASPNPPPTLPREIQYWASVIMRNACRKDESRGGIRQCANMLCGKWESFPRQFAKCRRCRKAKYCGKECQSKAWSEGHRFWCSVREGDDVADNAAQSMAQSVVDQQQQVGEGEPRFDSGPAVMLANAHQERLERRQARERERLRLAAATVTAADIHGGFVEGNDLATANANAAAATGNNPPIDLMGFPMTAFFDEPSNQPPAEANQDRLPNGTFSPTPVSIPIGVRRRFAPSLPPPPVIPPPPGSILGAYSEQEQATIRNFLQAVGITGQQGDGTEYRDTGETSVSGARTGYGAAETDLGAPQLPMQSPSPDIFEGLVGLQRLSVLNNTRLERRRAEGEGQLPERIQALEVVDRQSMQTIGDQMDDEDVGDEDEEMILG